MYVTALTEYTHTHSHTHVSSHSSTVYLKRTCRRCKTTTSIRVVSDAVNLSADSQAYKYTLEHDCDAESADLEAVTWGVERLIDDEESQSEASESDDDSDANSLPADESKSN